MLDLFAQPDTWVALATLSAMEIVLGIDNVVFLAILSGRLPGEQQPAARRIGLGLALGMRIVLLLAITWVMGLTRELFQVLGRGFSGRDLILLAGGLFLIGKATVEIHDKLEVKHGEELPRAGSARFGMVIAQIALLDMVFSLDSVITAVGMAQHLSVMIAAVVIAMAVMLAFAGAIGAFVERHPTMKVLALAFLILIGVMLVAEGVGQHIERGYAYFAMAFSLGVELLNMRMRRAQQAPVRLHGKFESERSPGA
ncbi:MAG TPA: TerC family protein [Anaeromyxobacteraceae bacterium]|nr:TerC family protein [Anaeromyxobacteraceae bacterium]